MYQLPELFELTELVTFMQVPSLQSDIATLARSLTTIEIRMHIGAGVYDAYTDLSPFKPIALQVAKRVVFNPDGFRSEAIDDYKYEIATEELQAPELTEKEMATLTRIVGKLAGKSRAFSITPAAPVSCAVTRVQCLVTCSPPTVHYCC